MKRFLLAAAAIAVSGAVHAADLVVDAVGPGEALADLGAYVRVMGGLTFPDVLLYQAFPFDTDQGVAFGAAVGLETPVPGLALEVDALYTSAAYTGQCLPEGCFSKSLSVMGNAVYSVGLNDMFSLYGGAGAGLIHVKWTFEGIQEDSGVGAGYQVFAGVEASITEDVALTLELRHQAAFDFVEISGDNPPYDVEYKRTAAMGGIRYSF